MAFTSSGTGSPVPSSLSANPEGQTNASSGTQTDTTDTQGQTSVPTQTDTETTDIEPVNSRYIRSSAPSPSPTLSSLPPPSFPTPNSTTTRPIIHPGLEFTPSIYSPRPSLLTSSPSSADATRSNSPMGVGPTRPASPARLVAECEPMPLVWEMPSSPVLAHAVPVPVPASTRVPIPNTNTNPDPDPEQDADRSSETTTTTTTTTAPIAMTTTPTPTPTATTTPSAATTEQPGPAQAAPSWVSFPLPPLPPQTQIDTHIYIPNHNTPNQIPNPNPIPSNTNIRSLPNYGPFPPYGHGLFFPDSDLHSYTVTEGDGYWPAWGHATGLGLGADEEGVVSVRVGRWVYRYLSRPLAVGLDPAVRSREGGEGRNGESRREAEDSGGGGGGTGTGTGTGTETEGVDGEGVQGIGEVEGVERETSHRLLGRHGRGWIWGRSSHERS
ncbi:hypothetical protein SMACR_06910 [Sordaria macrospora]|uniref:Uncharacterized protein n=1 Tax=Sordaria macrospora TaxID=5147 RepID=A0A8S8ZU94_SORMA|nr:hypothetical protein SMACR_06910 [Sordaria macrospora]KAH7634083.1 hypothetical protein B0T09DRAFT_102201 [Sordaria sp. MPI-SDFR-AT-0083]WPJ59565.1 hypothetical protein SMAC4_06910 [Sordaria macrospora]